MAYSAKHVPRSVGGPPGPATSAELELLYQLSQELLVPDRELEPFLDAVLDRLTEFGVERGMLTVYDRDQGEVRHEASRGLPAQRARRRPDTADSVIGSVVHHGTTALVRSVGNEPIFVNDNGTFGCIDPRAIAYICAPLVTHRQQVVGTLSVYRRWPDQDALEADARLFTVIGTTIGEAVRHWRDHLEERLSREEAEELLADLEIEKASPREMVGTSRQIRAIFRLIRQVARVDTTVLIRGESGTGKELAARAIHAASHRSSGPFVSVNCGALPEQLVESELFGHVRGAYTGAVATRRGRFELAERGTIFLDEVGELPLMMQVKLLRVLQNGEIHRVGDERPKRLNVRVIAATNANLEESIQDGTFRDDLYYRLNVFPIYLPPLRDRKSDIMLLADHFVEKYSRLHGTKVLRISTPAIQLMTAYHWPGNVRELENCVARAVLLTDDGVIRAHHLPPTLQTGDSSGTTKAGSLEGMTMAFEREILVEAMKNANGNMTGAARALATTPRILAYRLKKHGLHRELVSRRRRG